MISHCLYTLTHCTQHSCSTAKSHSPIRQTIELGKSLAQLGKIMKFALLQNIGKCGRYEILYIYLFVLRAEKFYRYICHSPPQSLAIMEDIFKIFGKL